LIDENAPVLATPGREVITKSDSPPYKGTPLDLQANIAKRGGAFQLLPALSPDDYAALKADIALGGRQ
jgi:hypothetical protein